jgi:alpha-N-acetylglucosaminidase
MQNGDPEAIWVMQAWLFMDLQTWTDDNIKAYLSGVPDDKLILLDLFSEVMPFYNRENSFYGKRWVST